MKQYRKSDPQDRRGPDADKIRAYHREYYRKNRPYDKVRESVLELLGGKCVHCGIEDRRVLQIDHINGGGSKHHKERGSAGVARDAIKNPDGYQLLCANCNWIKRYENNENPQRLYVEPLDEGEDIVQL